MRFGLKEQTINEIKTIFSGHPGIEKAIIYGSRAKGNFRNGSDIDLVLYAPKLAFSDLLQIEDQLDDLNLPWKIDLSLMHHISNADLISHIHRVGLLFYQNEEVPNINRDEVSPNAN